MDYWTVQIFRYCERGSDPTFWAEPINAITNSAFIIAGFLALAEMLGRRTSARGAAEVALVMLVFAMGIGSFLFHTYATRWASYADTGPIGIFMLAYLVYTLRRFFSAHWLVAIAGLGLFVLALRAAGDVSCQLSFLPVTNAMKGPCLNGSMGYVPALAVLALFSVALAIRRHAVWRFFAAATIVFGLSLTARTLDWEWCALTRISSGALGTHFIWHLLNATTLYLVLIGALRHGHKPGK